MQVTISGKVEPKKAQFTFNATDLGNTTIGGVVTINGNSYTIKDSDGDGTADTWAEVIKDMEKSGVLGDYKITEDNGKVTLTAKEAGKMNTPPVSYKETLAATANGTHTATGAAAVAGTVNAPGTPPAVPADDTATVTINGKAYSLAGYVNGVSAPTTASITTDDGKYTVSMDKDGAFTVALAAGVTGDASNGEVEISVNGTAQKYTITGGKDAVKDTWTYDVTGWNDSALGKATVTTTNGTLDLDYDKLSAAGERGIKVGDYVATLDGNTLTLTAQTGGTPADPATATIAFNTRSEEHTSELQSQR